ncbi:right-handed parallel beta-helix repeat-containing protein [Arthrobacter sp. zg-Y769]|uniref:right-handed parallel beta-helix repeat-containing protein n=1 Tax=Arthrobacter sp. zg-Y769 TaxID=2894191 RepID=UPI001E3B8A97|nr:right-handed parallel beta-helix repeat-containing protein [Arthrobacter sp. zg-Y769]MCC9206392.1 right-handed parallel beta-helix repeat-containing protein [Arthrobacter sp. zg-Y769]
MSRRSKLTALILAVVALAVVAIVVVAGLNRPGSQDVARDQQEPQTQPTQDAGEAPAPVTTPVQCPEPTVRVTTSTELENALDAARPGDVVGLAAGTYTGNFTASAEGTAEQPITLCGNAESILDGGTTDDGYVFHLDNSSYWALQGFTVRNGQKGVMVDQSTNNLIQGLTVTTTGDEAIHLRKFSTDNRVIGNTISNTGLRKPKFGEGIYIGTAESNWCDISNCEPDRSDRNSIEGNTITETTSESVDIKEGTSDGVLRANTFDGSGIIEADSWVDVKGRDWVIDGNTGINSPLDGFQTHEIIDGWGTDNVFRDNDAQVNGPGLGYSLKPVRDNIVECSNTASAAGEGLSNEPCTSG